jgi:elongation factor P
VQLPSSVQHRRNYKAPISDIKKGWVIEHLGKLWEVTETSQSRKTAQRRAHINMELRDLAAGTKKMERFRVEDRVETIILDVHKCIYSRSEGKKLFFTNAETGEEVSVRKEMVGPVEAYLKPGTSVARLSVHNGEAVTVKLPGKAVVTLKEADATQSATAGYKKAVLDNGRTVRVPPFLAAGDTIVVSLPDEVYISKSDGSALDDDENEDEDDDEDEEEEDDDEEDDEDEDEDSKKK